MLVVGIDEVGRGCLAGPLVVGAVALNKQVENLKDSKQLSRKQRESLSAIIKQNAAYIGIGWSSVKEIDSLGLTKALSLAATRALSSIKDTQIRYLLDGNFNYLIDAFSPVDLIVHGDSLVPQISAASIMAKVARDEFMIALSDKYEPYGFNKNVGYGTKQHLEAIRQYGPTDLHRRSFEPIKSILLS